MSAHAVISPSGIYQLVACPGSLRMQQPYPETQESKDEAMEGEAAHWVLSEELLGRGMAGPTDRAPNGWAIDAEMVEAVELAADWVDEQLAAQGLTREALAVETPVAIRRVHELCWGTPDIRWWAPGKHLFVPDFKYGYDPVEVFENYQLVAYAAGAIEQAGLHDLEVKVTLAIIQPRAQHRDGPIRTWTVNASELRALVNLMAMAANEALSENPRTYATPEGCKHCRARWACPTNAKAAGRAMDYAGTAIPSELTPEGLSVELRYAERQLKLLEARTKGLKAQGEAMARNGKRLPHHMMAQGLSRLQWRKPDAEVLVMGQMLGVDLAKPPEAVTPNQARDRGLSENWVNQLAEKRPGAMQLVPDDGSTWRKVFGGNT